MLQEVNATTYSTETTRSDMYGLQLTDLWKPHLVQDYGQL